MNLGSFPIPGTIERIPLMVVVLFLFLCDVGDPRSNPPCVTLWQRDGMHFLSGTSWYHQQSLTLQFLCCPLKIKRRQGGKSRNQKEAGM